MCTVDLAFILRSSPFSSKDIHRVRHRFKMSWIAARTIPAQMIER
jgi:hypothetical protein